MAWSRISPTCKICKWSVRVVRKLDTLDTLVCMNHTEAFGPGTVAPTFDRRVPYDYYCAFWEGRQAEAFVSLPK